jgi:hypothetical protein
MPPGILPGNDPDIADMLTLRASGARRIAWIMYVVMYFCPILACRRDWPIARHAGPDGTGSGLLKAWPPLRSLERAWL